MSISRLVVPLGIVSLIGCLSTAETVVMEEIPAGEIVERRPIITAPESLKPVTPPKEINNPPAEVAPPPNKLPPGPNAQPLPARPSGKEKRPQ